MSSQGQAVFPIAPPVAKYPVVDVKTGCFTLLGLNLFQQMWAAIQADGGLYPGQQTIYNMSGDGTLSTAGVLKVTKTNNVDFGFFATGTNAANLTGTVPFAQLPAPLNSENPGTVIGRAGAAGTPQEITVSSGLEVVGTSLVTEDSQVTTVSALPAQPYRQGARRFVSDLSAYTFGAAATGGGGSPGPVFSTGTQWLIG